MRLALELMSTMPASSCQKSGKMLNKDEETDISPVVLPKESPSLRLLMSIRDEAHRFAVAAHRRRRGRSRLSSPLLDVPGVGPVTAKKLLRAFLTTDAVKAAPLERLEKAVGRRAAAAVRAWAEHPSGEATDDRGP